ncbi:MAG: prepilin-type N-terminal cleavage/methylation domain-containing protein, partial [Planctomycetota bacterium]|nr:prepilin-type N-terminal cleavage/methylation domain-containing protein [Planctomycetota bacterium]
MVRQGMTLIEVLLVVTILLVIASAVVPRLVNRQEKANVDTTKISLKGLEQ